MVRLLYFKCLCAKKAFCIRNHHKQHLFEHYYSYVISMQQQYRLPLWYLSGQSTQIFTNLSHQFIRYNSFLQKIVVWSFFCILKWNGPILCTHKIKNNIREVKINLPWFNNQRRIKYTEFNGHFLFHNEAMFLYCPKMTVCFTSFVYNNAHSTQIPNFFPYKHLMHNPIISQS